VTGEGVWGAVLVARFLPNKAEKKPDMALALAGEDAASYTLASKLARSGTVKVGVFEARNRLSELIEAAERGEEVIITRRGAPAVKLVPAPTEHEELVARRRASLARLAVENAKLEERLGRKLTWEEIKAWRDEDRP